jgi:hypothetical protein
MLDGRNYLKALSTDWVALMSSLASLVLTFIPLMSDAKRVPDWTYWLAAAICLIVASYRVWLKEHRALIAERAKSEPVLLLEFKHSERTFRESGSYTNPDLDRPSGNYISGRWERYSVRVTNNSAHTISNVNAEITAIEPRPGNLHALPLRLQVRNHDEHLNPGGEMYFLVAHFDSSTPNRISLSFSDSAYREIPASRYLLTIRVTAKDAPSVTKKFSVSVAGDRLYMHEEPQPVATAP